jgi:hypothetical protein
MGIDACGCQCFCRIAVQDNYILVVCLRRLYLGDKELNIVSYSLLLSVLEYQTAVMRGDFETADRVLPTVPRNQRTRVAHFLEKQVCAPPPKYGVWLLNDGTVHTPLRSSWSGEDWTCLSVSVCL